MFRRASGIKDKSPSVKGDANDKANRSAVDGVITSNLRFNLRYNKNSIESPNVQSLMNHWYTQAHEGCSDPSFAGVTTCEFCHADEGGICFRIANKNYRTYKSATQRS